MYKIGFRGRWMLEGPHDLEKSCFETFVKLYQLIFLEASCKNIYWLSCNITDITIPIPETLLECIFLLTIFLQFFLYM